ncbi:hypothetical protein GUITHDRAFT_113335 [Guillardia theta CCMP2712]|uniref:Uncharacterized protein n=1 Tax=Guillardia theta (strain CCMP2712) TaxID=905079 RepID=L1IXD7_GUITC|nr:hypothetical protein GUITHDRAFT_113335 [Guillardia theta CCMP2712]EKX40549.1 hypothetical protein GUITHDRAFT_113335 [Guillardia theta CCMP2712]|eukprot:XP_005827529.1 hypothetical protein GUITHDRAFT_113335 [Guillardia theta CCMP2712]
MVHQVVPKEHDGIWSLDVPAPLCAVMCGASFYLGYRFNAWVGRQYEQLKKLKTKFSERSKVWAFRAAEAVLAGGIIFVLVRARVKR